jgi:hypothetical protein
VCHLGNWPLFTEILKFSLIPDSIVLAQIVHSAIFVVFSLAPSTAPIISISSINPRTLTVTWSPLDCIERNGEVIGYAVNFYEIGHMELGIPMGVTGDSFTASNLIPGGVYTFVVAAINDYGTGPYGVENITTISISMPSIK